MKNFYSNFKEKISQKPTYGWQKGWSLRTKCMITLGNNIINEYAQQGTINNIKHWFEQVFLK